MALRKKILLAGFSGVGKSAFLKALKKSAPEGWEDFEDLDERVLRLHGQNHARLEDFILEKGWDVFRFLERQELEVWLSQDQRGVLALGGGTLTPELWSLYGHVPKFEWCCLHASFETCWRRLEADGLKSRPLSLKGKDKLHEIYQERQPLFQRITWKLVNEGSLVDDLVQAFWQHVQSS